MKSINPATGHEINYYQEHTEAEISDAINNSYQAYQSWRENDLDQRAQALMRVADMLEKNCFDYANLMSTEMGKPIVQARAEVNKSAWVCRYYAEHATHFLQDESIKTDYQESYITYNPLGPILGIMPWNFPFWQVLRFAAPTLMAGNTIILKHASNVSGCALAIEELFRNCLPMENCFQSLLIHHNKIPLLISHPKVRAVSLTGSTNAGKKVAALAGAHLKKCVLELGGNDPYIILPDADIEKAVKACAQSRLLNNGQSCIAAKRFIVHKDVLDEFTSSLKDNFTQVLMGNPHEEKNTLGPLARIDLRDELDDQVQRSLKAGAKCILGGKPLKGNGAFYPPTILVDVSEDMPAFNEELFGPVASIIVAKDTNHAIELANNSQYGLGAAIFSKDIKKAQHMASKQIESGACFINDFVKSDPRLPFGGIKDSGYGRELGVNGIREFTNIKTVCL